MKRTHRLALAYRHPEKSRPEKQIFWSGRCSHMLPRGHAKFRAKPTTFGRQTDVHGSRAVPRPREIPTRKTDFLVRTEFKHVTEASRKDSCKTDAVWSSNERARLAGASRGLAKSRPGKQIFWSGRRSYKLPRPHAKVCAKPTPFGRQTDVHGTQGRTGTPGPAPGKSPTRNPDFFFGMMFFYVPEASCKISAKTDPVWDSYQKLCKLRKSMFVPVTWLFVHNVYIGGTMGSGAPRAAPENDRASAQEVGRDYGKTTTPSPHDVNRSRDRCPFPARRAPSLGPWSLVARSSALGCSFPRIRPVSTPWLGFLVPWHGFLVPWLGFLVPWPRSSCRGMVSSCLGLVSSCHGLVSSCLGLVSS